MPATRVKKTQAKARSLRQVAVKEVAAKSSTRKATIGDELGSQTMGKLTHTNLQGSATSSRG